MTHEQAVEKDAVNRYILLDLSINGRLTPEELSAFEEHFFGCAECAAAVRLCARFLANLRAAIRETR